MPDFDEYKEYVIALYKRSCFHDVIEGDFCFQCMINTFSRMDDKINLLSKELKEIKDANPRRQRESQKRTGRPKQKNQARSGNGRVRKAGSKVQSTSTKR